MLKVAVIGAGPAGLVTARELIRHGAMPTVFEAESRIGGVWVYQSAREDDLLGINSHHRIYSSLYKSLCTNIPRDLMAFLDYTFDSSGGGDDNWARFPHHSHVLAYLESFSAHFELAPHIRLNTRVTQVLKSNDSKNQHWEVTSESTQAQHSNIAETGNIELFDAVIVCSGHYTKPRIPPLAQIENFLGEISHSHNYREPEGFRDKKVALWGTSASGFDIANEIATVAKHVYWLGNVFEDTATMGPTRTVGPSPAGFNSQGQLIVADQPIDIDALMFCTGYHYDFEFVKEQVTVTDNWVHPLYRDIVSPTQPTLGFVGLPFLIIPFPVFEMQAKWFVKHLVGGCSLPDAGEMTHSTNLHASEKQRSGVLKRHYHRLGDQQFDYYNQLAQECGEQPLPAWFRLTWSDAQKAREADPINFRNAIITVRGPTVCRPTRGQRHP